MEKRYLGNSDLNLTVIGLGTWAIGGEWAYGWGAQQDSDSISTIKEALGCGINWIDTAPAYGLGRSEIVVGKAIQQWVEAGHERPFIATKCGLVPIANGKVESNLSRQSIITECELSLKRLGIEQIDLYQIHWPKPAGQIAEAFETLLLLKEQGKIRWPGVSNFNVSQLQHIKRYGEAVSLQPPYSLIRRDIEEQIVPWCLMESMGMIVYSPLQTGLLTGKVTQHWVDQLPDDDWRKNQSDYFKEPKLSRILELNRAIERSALGQAHPLTEIAIQWALHRAGVTAAICGARKPQQIREICHALSWQMSLQEIAFLDQLYLEFYHK